MTSLPPALLPSLMPSLPPALPPQLLYKDMPRDVNPSGLLGFVAHFAVAAEISLGPLCLFCPSVGAPLATCFHLYILSMTPFASVMEWNCFCIAIIQALFVHDGFSGYASPRALALDLQLASPWLVGFLGFVLVLVPLYGRHLGLSPTAIYIPGEGAGRGQALKPNKRM